MSAPAGHAMHEEEALGKVYDSRLVARLWPYVSPYRAQVALTLALVIPMFALEAAPAWIVKVGLDRVFPGDASLADGDGTALSALFEAPAGFDPLLWLAGLYLTVIVASAALLYGHSVLMSHTGYGAMRDLRRDVFAHIHRLHLGYFDTHPVGRLVTRATNDVENVAEMFSAGIVALITDLFKMAGFALVLFLVAPKLALVTFTVVPVLAVAAVAFRLKVREAYRLVRVRIARINTYLQETVTGMKVVQLFTREDRNRDEFDALNAMHRDAWFMSIRYDAALFAAVEVATGIAAAVILGYGIGLVEVGVLYVFIQYMRRFFMPLRDLSAKYSVMQSAMASSERIFQLLDTPPAVRDPERPVSPPPPRGEVAFEDVWFAYQGDDWVLKDLSLRVRSGERVALVGATGAGKTSVIKLLTRLYDVSRGRILLDGVDVRELAQDDLRGRIATVLQDVVLFSGTVAENIALGRDDISQAQIEEACRAVEAHRFIERLPQGYQTPVREHGTNLSAGQRQLLSFARALVHGAQVLVLDEATSSIDPDTEALLQRGVHVLMEGKTAIVIAHRLSTIQDVDTIHVLHRGRIVESGSHDELLARRGLYHRLYRLQYAVQERTAEDEAAAQRSAG